MSTAHQTRIIMPKQAVNLLHKWVYSLSRFYLRSELCGYPKFLGVCVYRQVILGD